MKKRKILYLFPLAALVLSGCTFQEGWEITKNWTNEKVFTPVVDFFKGLLGIEDKKEEKKDDEEKPTPGPEGGGEGEGEGGGGGEQEGYKSVTTEEAIALCDQAGSGNVTQLLRVTGVVAFGATKNNNGWTGKFESSGEKVLNFDSVRTEDEYSTIDGATIVIEGYAELYNGAYKVGYLPANVSPTGEKYNPQLIELTPAQQKEIASISSVEGPSQVFVGAEVTVNQVTVNVTYSDQSTGQVRPDRVELDTSVANDAAVLTAYVGNLSGTCTVKVVENTVLTPEQVIAMCDEAGSGNVVEGELTIKGVVADGAELNSYGQWVGEYETEGEKKLTFDSAKPVEGLTVESLSGKIMTLKGYAELYNGTYKVGYLPANVSPTGAKYNPTILNVEEQQFEITGVEVNPSSLQLEVGEQATLTATVNPAKASQDVTWTIDNGNSAVEIVSFENGKVVALAEGTAIVTATSVADSTKSASCEVTVTSATKTLQSIAITGEATKTVYEEEEAYSAAGLKVMAHYDKGEDVDVTEAAELTCSPAAATLGDTKFTVTATYSTVEPATKDVAVTVNAVSKMKKAYEAGLALQNNGVTSEAYTFSGVCTAITGNSFFLQDDGYGMYVYNKATANLAIGKTVEVTATLTKYNGLVETKSVSASAVTGDGVLPTALEITKYDDIGRANILANAANAVFKSKDAEWTSSKASLAVFTIGSDDVTVKFDKYGFEDAKAQLLNDATAGDVMNLGAIVTSINNDNLQLLFAGTSTLTNANKVITAAEVTKSPEEVGLNGSISKSDVEVTVTFQDQTTGKGRILEVTVDSSTAGSATANVTIIGFNETLHFTVDVKSDVVVQSYSQYFGSNNNDGYMNSSNTAYANVYNVTLNGIDWKIPGNQNLAYGLKIGGKLSAETTRSLITQSTFAAPITSVVVTTGTKDSAITVTKCAMKVYSSAANAAADSNMVEEVTASYVDAGTITFAIPANSNWSGIYFALAFSMTSTASSSNKGMVITNITVNF